MPSMLHNVSLRIQEHGRNSMLLQQLFVSDVRLLKSHKVERCKWLHLFCLNSKSLQSCVLF